MDIHGTHPLRDYFESPFIAVAELEARLGRRGGRVRFDERDMGRPNDIPDRTWGFCMWPPFCSWASSPLLCQHDMESGKRGMVGMRQWDYRDDEWMSENTVCPGGRVLSPHAVY